MQGLFQCIGYKEFLPCFASGVINFSNADVFAHPSTANVDSLADDIPGNDATTNNTCPNRVNELTCSFKGNLSEGTSSKGNLSEGTSSKGNLSEGTSSKGDLSEGTSSKGNLSEGTSSINRSAEASLCTGSDPITGTLAAAGNRRPGYLHSGQDLRSWQDPITGNIKNGKYSNQSIVYALPSIKIPPHPVQTPPDQTPPDQHRPLNPLLLAKCTDDMKRATRVYSRKQVAWIKSRFLKKELSFPVHRLDSTVPARWLADVQNPAFEIVRAALANTPKVMPGVRGDKFSGVRGDKFPRLVEISFWVTRKEKGINVWGTKDKLTGYTIINFRDTSV